MEDVKQSFDTANKRFSESAASYIFSSDLN